MFFQSPLFGHFSQPSIMFNRSNWSFLPSIFELLIKTGHSLLEFIKSGQFIGNNTWNNEAKPYVSKEKKCSNKNYIQLFSKTFLKTVLLRISYRIIRGSETSTKPRYCEIRVMWNRVMRGLPVLKINSLVKEMSSYEPRFRQIMIAQDCQFILQNKSWKIFERNNRSLLWLYLRT